MVEYYITQWHKMIAEYVSMSMIHGIYSDTKRIKVPQRPCTSGRSQVLTWRDPWKQLWRRRREGGGGAKSGGGGYGGIDSSR